MPKSTASPLDYYKRHSSVTDPREFAYLLDGLPSDIPRLCQIVQGVVMHREEGNLYDVELTEERKQEGETRYAAKILQRIRELETSDLQTKRIPEKRFAGTCRDFALILCTMLRHQGTPARLRCGFAGYFNPGRYDDHWVCEYWNRAESRWVLVDAEIDGVEREAYQINIDSNDLPRDKFLFAGQAWQACRSGDLDPELFGVHEIDIKGLWFIRSNVVRDLAALNKTEVLPWDYWGISDKPFEEFSSQELALIDEVARLASIGDKFSEIRKLYEEEERLRVPAVIKSYTSFQGLQFVNLTAVSQHRQLDFNGLTL